MALYRERSVDREAVPLRRLPADPTARLLVVGFDGTTTDDGSTFTFTGFTADGEDSTRWPGLFFSADRFSVDTTRGGTTDFAADGLEG